ncbi:MAG: hypothetical protein FWH19_03985 [Treponema sp.]|nr:hypothetical protein [Treponema sp.]
MRGKRFGIFCGLLMLLCSLAPALDFGLVLDQGLEYSGSGDDTALYYTGILIPRVSGLLGEQGGFYVSAGLSYESDPLAFLPELLRADLYWRYGWAELRLGRMFYSDPLGFIAVGLFDGGRFSFDSPVGSFSAGAWYTGLLSKKRALVEMTPKELEHNNKDIDYNDFANTYFAPSRVLAALGWEHQGLARRFPVALSILGQFDLSAEELNSQYLAGKFTVPLWSFAFDLGGCLELIQHSGNTDTAHAAELGFAWLAPTQQLSLTGRYSSAQSDNSAAFLPLNTVSQGNIPAYKLSGISLISLDYSARLHRTFFLGLESSYFMLSDSSLDERMLGGELFGTLDWSPLSDISISLGAGAFLPSLGDVAPNADAQWRIELNVVLSLF